MAYEDKAEYFNMRDSFDRQKYAQDLCEYGEKCQAIVKDLKIKRASEVKLESQVKK